MDPMVDSNGSFLVNIWYMYGIHGSYEDRRSDSFHSNFRTHLGFALHPMGNIVHHSTHHHLQEGFFWDVFQGTLESNLRKLNFRSFRCSEIPQEVQVVDPKYFFSLTQKSPARKVGAGAPCHSTCFGVKKNQNYPSNFRHFIGLTYITPFITIVEAHLVGNPKVTLLIPPTMNCFIDWS